MRATLALLTTALLILWVSVRAAVNPLQPNVVTTNTLNTATNGQVLAMSNGVPRWMFSAGGTNPVIVTNLTTIVISNVTLVSSNIYVTNLFATTITNVNNEYVTNLYTTNLFATTITNVNNQYVTNLFATTITNVTLVTSNEYVTNLYVTNLTVQNITNVTQVTSNLTVINSFQSTGSTELDHLTVTNYLKTLFHDFTGSTNINANLSSFQGVTLSASTAFSLSNSTNGTRILVRFIQDGTGGWTPTIDNVNWVANPDNWNTNASGISYVTISDTGGGTADALLVGTNSTSGTSLTISVNSTNVVNPDFMDTSTVLWGLTGSTVSATALNRVETLTALTWASTTTISVLPSETNYRTLTLGGDTTFAAGDQAAGRWVTVLTQGATTNCALAWPGWIPMNSALPSNLAANKHMSFTVFFQDGTDTNAFVNVAVEP